MALRSIKDHPFYIRMRLNAPEEVAAWVLGEVPIEEACQSNRLIIKTMPLATVLWRGRSVLSEALLMPGSR